MPINWQEGPLELLGGILIAAFLGTLLGLALSPVGLPPTALVVWLLRSECVARATQAQPRNLATERGTK